MTRQFEIEGRRIGPGEPCFVIAEVGINHNGDADLAIRMIDAIAEAGADCVKFQTFRAREFINDPDETFTYKSQGKEITESMLAMFERVELKRDEFARLFARARERGLVPLSTPTDRDAVDLLDELGAPAFKIGSDDLVYSGFLRYVAAKGKPMIVSTGMADAEDIDRAVAAIRGAGNEEIALLHCVSVYPTPPEEMNLRKIATLQQRFDLPIGFSDHSTGTTGAVGAAALGMTIYERHFTLDRNLPGPDHWFSADPDELAATVREIRRMEQSLGSATLEPSDGERKMRSLARRSICAATDLAAGHVVTEADLAYRRPGTGLMPYEADVIVGRRTRVAIPADTMLAFDMLEPAESGSEG